MDLVRDEDGIREEVKQVRSNITNQIRKSVSDQLNTACKAEEMRDMVNECMTILNGFYNHQNYLSGVEFFLGYHYKKFSDADKTKIKWEEHESALQLAACLEIFNGSLVLHSYLSCMQQVDLLNRVNSILETLWFQEDNMDNLEAAIRGILAGVTDYMTLNAFQKLEQLEDADKIDHNVHNRMVQWYQNCLLKFQKEFVNICRRESREDKWDYLKELQAFWNDINDTPYRLGEFCADGIVAENG